MTACDSCAPWVDGTRRAHHQAACRELVWPDGRPRGALVDPDPLPPFLEDPDARAAYRIANPGGLSPIALEFGDIFAGLAERMIATYIETARRQWWICLCGRTNRDAQLTCTRCGASRVDRAA